jgi:hypothetical protein
MILFFAVQFIVLCLIAWGWATGFESMKNNHPDYDGNDFLNWDKDIDNDKNKDK